MKSFLKKNFVLPFGAAALVFLMWVCFMSPYAAALISVFNRSTPQYSLIYAAPKNEAEAKAFRFSINEQGVLSGTFNAPEITKDNESIRIGYYNPVTQNVRAYDIPRPEGNDGALDIPAELSALKYSDQELSEDGFMAGPTPFIEEISALPYSITETQTPLALYNGRVIHSMKDAVYYGQSIKFIGWVIPPPTQED